VNLSTVFFEDEERVIPVPEPGERCVTCDRRVPKPRKSTSPETRRLVAVLPTERATGVDEALDALQAFTGADATSYPRGSVLEALVLLGGQHREELRAWFAKEDV
jgi:acyl-CoA reductase-like NAD-dependent aldehyde dehydrogenase